MSEEQTIWFKRIAVIGLGLIGSSLLRAIRKHDLAETCAGFDQSADVRAVAATLGLVDALSETIPECVADADLVILSTPVGALDDLCANLNGHLKPGAILMDVGSVKGSVVRAAQVLGNDVHFVPAHPVAGTEQSGPAAGFAHLFAGRWCILTPLARDDAAYLDAVDRVDGLWRAIGAQTERMDAEHHDLALAVTSHLPHLIAFTLVGAADDLESVTQAEIVKYSAGGFRDFTRIAASDPVMWRDVFLNNKDAVLEVLGRFTEELALLQRAIRWGDGATLSEVFTRGRALRKAIVEAGQETDEPNFGRDR